MDNKLKLNAGVGSNIDADGNIYTTVTIGTQTWMVENLKTTKYNDGTPITNITTDASWGSYGDEAYCWYSNDATTYKVYGALYNQYAVQNSKLPPIGWRVSSYSDWATLVTYIGGGDASAGLKLKESGTTHWNAPNNATNEYGFTALGGGERSNLGVFRYIKDYGFWWTVLDTAVFMIAAGQSISYPSGYDYKHGLGVRCIQDTAVSSQSTANKLKLSGSAAANKLLLDSSSSTFMKLGLLYNWYAATDASLIYADGWKVPSTTEFNTLRANESNIGTTFKEAGTTYWTSPNTWATNTRKFNARGAGWRNSTDAGFQDIYEKIQMLTTADSGANTTVYAMEYDLSTFNFGAYTKTSGASIRLLKVTTSLSDGETGTYTGNDGKVYRTICINTQEWLADNLAETKYRDGTFIPEVTGNAAWLALSTGAMCAYNNDWGYV